MEFFLEDFDLLDRCLETLGCLDRLENMMKVDVS